MEPVRVVRTGPVHDYGEPGAVERLQTPFVGFAALPHAVGDCTDGPEADLHGHTWKLSICPGGNTEEDKDYVSVFLVLCGPYPEHGVKAEVTLRVINHAGEADKFKALWAGQIWGEDTSPTTGPSWGHDKLIKRADVLNATNGWLKDGALVVEADTVSYTHLTLPTKRIV